MGRIDPIGHIVPVDDLCILDASIQVGRISHMTFIQYMGDIFKVIFYCFQMFYMFLNDF